MAQRAASLGQRIAVVAALASTIAPTRQLLMEAAAEVGKTVTLVAALCADAWPAFERGDLQSYHVRVAQTAAMAAPHEAAVSLYCSPSTYACR